MKPFLMIGLLLVSMAIFAEEQPNSTVYGDQSDKTDPRSYEVVFISIDGTNQHQKQRVTLDPGPHLFEVATTKTSRYDVITSKRMSIDIKPCTSYYFSAQHSKERRGKYWTLEQREVPIEGCTYIEKPKPFDYRRDSRTSQYQAEMHAIAMRSFIFYKMDACAELKNNDKLIQWLTTNNSIVNAADLEIKSRIGALYNLKGDAETIKYFNAFANMLAEAESKILKAHGGDDNCSVNFEGWSNLEDLYPFNEVYKAILKEDNSTSSFLEAYPKALELFQNSQKQLN